MLDYYNLINDIFINLDKKIKYICNYDHVASSIGVIEYIKYKKNNSFLIAVLPNIIPQWIKYLKDLDDTIIFKNSIVGNIKYHRIILINVFLFNHFKKKYKYEINNYIIFNPFLLPYGLYNDIINSNISNMVFITKYLENKKDNNVFYNTKKISKEIFINDKNILTISNITQTDIDKAISRKKCINCKIIFNNIIPIIKFREIISCKTCSDIYNHLYFNNTDIKCKKCNNYFIKYYKSYLYCSKKCVSNINFKNENDIKFPIKKIILYDIIKETDCPFCKSINKNPLLLSCGHIKCINSVCIKRYNLYNTIDCNICQTMFKDGIVQLIIYPTDNQIFKNYIDTIKYFDDRDILLDDDSQECIICYNILKAFIKLKCKHILCYTCYIQLVNNNCPMCRQNMDDVDKIYLKNINIKTDILNHEFLINYIYKYYHKNQYIVIYLDDHKYKYDLKYILDKNIKQSEIYEGTIENMEKIYKLYNECKIILILVKNNFIDLDLSITDSFINLQRYYENYNRFHYMDIYYNFRNVTSVDKLLYKNINFVTDVVKLCI